jgi:hypothetical protein
MDALLQACVARVVQAAPERPAGIDAAQKKAGCNKPKAHCTGLAAQSVQCGY